MKTRLLTLIIATIAFVSCNKPTFNINVELQNAEGKMVYLKKMLDKYGLTAISTHDSYEKILRALGIVN